MAKIRLDFSVKKTLHLDFSHRVFKINRPRQIFVLARQGNKYGYFLTMDDGGVSLVKIPKENGSYKLQRPNEGQVGKEYKYIEYDLEPLPYDPVKAARIMWDSFLPKSSKAEMELRVMLGLSPATQSSEEKPSRSSTRPRKESKRSSSGFTLAALCVELNMEPGKARKLLRGSIQKPEGGWQWSTEAEFNKVKKLLKGG